MTLNEDHTFHCHPCLTGLRVLCAWVCLDYIIPSWRIKRRWIPETLTVGNQRPSKNQVSFICQWETFVTGLYNILGKVMERIWFYDEVFLLGAQCDWFFFFYALIHVRGKEWAEYMCSAMSYQRGLDEENAHWEGKWRTKNPSTKHVGNGWRYTTCLCPLHTCTHPSLDQ